MNVCTIKYKVEIRNALDFTISSDRTDNRCDSIFNTSKLANVSQFPQSALVFILKMLHPEMWKKAANFSLQLYTKTIRTKREYMWHTKTQSLHKICKIFLEGANALMLC